MNLVYIGPEIRRAGLRPLIVFYGGYPPTARELIKKEPKLKNLFVQPNKLTAALVAVRKRGTLLNTYYNQVKELNTSDGL